MHLLLHFPFSSQPLSQTVHYTVFPSCFLSFLSFLVPRGFLSCSARPPRLDSTRSPKPHGDDICFIFCGKRRIAPSAARSFVRWLHLPFGHAAFFLPSAINLYDVLPSLSLPSLPFRNFRLKCGHAPPDANESPSSRRSPILPLSFFLP